MCLGVARRLGRHACLVRSLTPKRVGGGERSFFSGCEFSLFCSVLIVGGRRDSIVTMGRGHWVRKSVIGKVLAFPVKVLAFRIRAGCSVAGALNARASPRTWGSPVTRIGVLVGCHIGHVVRVGRSLVRVRDSELRLRNRFLVTAGCR